MMIDRIFITVLLLSISGFVFCTVFFPLEKYAYRLTTAKTMVFVNTVALFSFVIPFYFIVSLFDRSEDYFGGYRTLVFEDVSNYEGVVGAIREMGVVEHFSSIWLLGAIFFFIKFVCKYIFLLHKVRANKFYMKDDDTWAKIFNRLKDEKHVQSVKLVFCYAIFTPCSVGIKDKFIVIPASMMNAFDEEEMEFILEHELYHVIHRDLPRKLLVMLLSCLNWFNPQFRALRINLSDWLEAATDEAVTEGFAFKKKLRYSQLIAKVMELERAGRAAAGFSVNFRGERAKKNIRRSMKIMQEKKKTGVFGKTVVVSVALLSLAFGNVAAKAADTPINQMFSKNVEVVNSEDVEVIKGTDILFDDNVEDSQSADVGEFVEFDLRDTADTTYEIIYNDTEAVLIAAEDSVEPQHIHHIIDVTIKEHKKQSDGSCITTYYEGGQCTFCETTWKGDVINEISFTKCPH